MPVIFFAPPNEPVRIPGPPPPKPTPTVDASPQVPAKHTPTTITYSGKLEVPRVDSFSCKKAKKQPVPNIGAMIPPELAGVGGPIATAIVTGTDVVRNIFKALGPKRVCTVRGGQYRQLVTVQRDGGAPDFWVGVGVQFRGREEAAWWVFRDKRSDTGFLSLQPGYPQTSQTGPKNTYLRVGNKPPGDLWPHVNIPRWRRSVPEELDQPFASVVRTGNDLTLSVWLPPRAPLSHLTVWGRRVVDEPVIWTIEWVIKPFG
jgi:hypothetical protein